MTPPIEDLTGATARSILERCLFENDGAAWTMFLDRFSDLIQRALLSSHRGSTYEEFGDWFPGWLFEQRKLHALYRALLVKIARGEVTSQ